MENNSAKPVERGGRRKDKGPGANPCSSRFGGWIRYRFPRSRTKSENDAHGQCLGKETRSATSAILWMDTLIPMAMLGIALGQRERLEIGRAKPNTSSDKERRQMDQGSCRRNPADFGDVASNSCP